MTPLSKPPAKPPFRRVTASLMLLCVLLPHAHPAAITAPEDSKDLEDLFEHDVGNESAACCEACLDDGYLSAAMPLAVGAGACFLVAATVVIVCKILIRRFTDLDDRSRDNESVSSMQLWINERLRDRPPRYEEPAPGMSTPVCAAVPIPETEKPPTYEFAVSESQTASFYERVVDENPPPPYTSVVQSDGGQGITNPGFVEDPFDSPFNGLPAAPSSSPAPSMLLTVSQAVAIREMMEVEGTSARDASPPPISSFC